jgi:hypothetical protein
MKQLSDISVEKCRVLSGFVGSWAGVSAAFAVQFVDAIAGADLAIAACAVCAAAGGGSRYIGPQVFGRSCVITSFLGPTGGPVNDTSPSDCDKR